MARKAIANTKEEHIVTEAQTPGLTRAAEAIADLPMLAAQQDATVRAVAAQIGYQLPADCTDPDLIQRDISANMRRSVEACLEVGRGLAVLKTACGHGNFIARLDVLGIEVNVAGRFIQSARKFSNSPTSANLIKALGNQSKLFEMLVLDDDQLEELELTGQTGELKLDAIATMSVKELRAALREAKADAEATDRVLEEKSKSVTKLQKQLSREIDPNEMWSEAMRLLSTQTVAHKTSIVEYATALDVIRERVMEQQAEPGHESALEQARSAIGKELWDAIMRCEEQIVAVRTRFEKTLGSLIGA